MNQLRIATIFFLLGQFIFLTTLWAQSNKRIKLLDANYVLLNGDSVLISTLPVEEQKEIRTKIKATATRNVKIAKQTIKSQPKKAYYFLKNTLLLDSTYLPAHAVFATLYLERKDTVRAINALEAAYRQTKSQQFLPILSALQTQYLAGDSEESVNLSALTSSNASQKYHYLKGKYLYERGEIEKAIIEFGKSKDWSYSELSGAAVEIVEKGNNDKIDLLESYVEDSLYHEYACYNLALIKSKNDELEAALLWIEKALANNDTLPNARFLRGKILYQKGNVKKALSDFNFCISAQFQTAYSLTNAAICEYDLSNYVGAIEKANSSIQLNSNEAKNYLVRGNAKEMQYDFSGACEDWYQAVDLGMKGILPKITQFCKANQTDK